MLACFMSAQGSFRPLSPADVVEDSRLFILVLEERTDGQTQDNFESNIGLYKNCGCHHEITFFGLTLLHRTVEEEVMS